MTLASVHPMLTPNQDDMRAHLEHVFGGYLDGRDNGRIELAWTENTPSPDGRYRLNKGETFDVEDIDRLIAKAVEVNSIPRTNVYIGAALRHPNTGPVGRCDDDDFYCATAIWCDLDDKDANDLAKQRMLNRQPSFVVRTGDYPHWRNQLWWRLTEPLEDVERVRALVSGVAHVMGGDTTVANPSRVMRLAGSIAWDQKAGRRPELTRVIPLRQPGLKAYIPDHLEALFPPLYSLEHVRRVKSGGPNVGVVRATDGLGLPTGKVVDGRERHMVNVICARLIDYIGQTGAAPSVDELIEHAWPVYEQTTDLSREGRNKPEFVAKCRATLRRFEQGKIRGVRSLDEAVAAYRTRHEAGREHRTFKAETPQTPGQESPFPYLTIPAIKSLPDARWIVDKVIPDDGLVFIYGPPGAYKSFLAFDLALSLVYGGQEWLGAEVRRHGAVIYVAHEGAAGMKLRIEAWQRSRQITNDEAPFALVRETISFMSAEDVRLLALTVEAAAQNLGSKPVAVVVDTVSRVLPGADENLQKEMTLFVSACDYLRSKLGVTVIGVHHAGKSGDMRGSTVFRGAGDAVFKLQKDEGTKGLATLECEKMKDAEDGWQKIVVARPEQWVPTGKLEPVSSLVLSIQDDKPPIASGDGGWPDLATCRKILGAIEAASKSVPWSPKSQTINEGRNASRRIHTEFGVSVEVAERMVQTWLDNGTLTYETVNKNTKQKGLRVTGSIG
jgi:KaiC/GvpD/RAD55 family RecA-like ATPase